MKSERMWGVKCRHEINNKVQEWYESNGRESKYKESLDMLKIRVSLFVVYFIWTIGLKFYKTKQFQFNDY